MNCSVTPKAKAHRRLKKRSLFIGILLIAGQSAVSQDYVNLVEVNTSLGLPATFAKSGEETTISEYNLTLNLPVKFNKRTALITGLYAESISARLTPDVNSYFSVYSVNPRLGLNLKHSEKWTGTYVFLPKISSGLSEITSRDLQYGGIAVLKYQKNSRLSYKFGGYYNSELFGPFFVPILGFYYRSPNEKWELNASLPLSADANYAFAPKWRAGFRFSAFVRSYHLNQERFDDQYLVKSTNEPTLYLHYELTPSFILQLAVGYSIARYYRTYGQKDKVNWGFSAFRFGDDRQQINTDFGDGVVVQLRMLYRFYLEEGS